MSNYGQYGNVEFGDERLSSRLIKLLEQLSGDPTASISAACKDPYQAKAAYRFTANENVSIEAITKITHDVTVENINASKPQILLIPQDTTEINYSNLKSANGMGNIGTKKTSMGILAHTAVAISETGMIFGLVAQKLWVRPPEEHGKSSKRDKLPISEKESYKWLETIEKAEASFPEETLVVHICDREADIYELFCKAAETGSNYLCRKRHDRKIAGTDINEKLDSFAKALPIAGTIKVNIARDSHTQRESRIAELEITHGKCRILKPSTLSGNKELPESMEVYVVTASEKTHPSGGEKIFWQLITNVSTESFEEAVVRINWYTQRWKVETFHRTLKSGCKVEELQSESAEKLKKLIAIYSIVALQIMELTYIGRTHSDESCEIVLTEHEWKLLYRVSKKTRDMPPTPPTIYEAVVMIAKLGGFLGRNSDGYPGVTVLWRGLTKFYTLLEAAEFLV